MTAILKQRLCGLTRDDSGVAFAFTVTAALIVFLFGFAVYACGETVRQRIELQNAADAAAYSAALVQADTISRIAVINRAMAWNYVMMTRRQMDHIVEMWLNKVLEQWNNSRAATQAYQNVCACHPRSEGANWRVGVSPGGGGGEVVHQLIRLNGSQDVFIPVLEAGRTAGGARNPAGILSSLRDCIVSMNKAEENLISGLKKRIENAVEFAVRADVSLTDNDKSVKNRRDIRWHIHDLQEARTYFETLSRDEQRFFGFGEFTGTAQSILGRGADVWLQLKGGEGFQRDYEQSGNSLSAMWYTYNQIWWHSKHGCVFAGIHVLPAAPVTGAMAQDAFFTGVAAKPKILKQNFFQPDGALVVGVSRPLNNPFAFIFGGGEQAGIFSAFNVGGGGQTMWAVSGARAGYHQTDWNKGEYRNRNAIPDRENLRITDWDAMFLPLRENDAARGDLLSSLAGKLGATRQFAGRNHFSGYSNLELNSARRHLHH